MSITTWLTCQSLLPNRSVATCCLLSNISLLWSAELTADKLCWNKCSVWFCDNPYPPTPPGSPSLLFNRLPVAPPPLEYRELTPAELAAPCGGRRLPQLSGSKPAKGLGWPAGVWKPGGGAGARGREAAAWAATADADKLFLLGCCFQSPCDVTRA